MKKSILITVLILLFSSCAVINQRYTAPRNQRVGEECGEYYEKGDTYCGNHYYGSNYYYYYNSGLYTHYSIYWWGFYWWNPMSYWLSPYWYSSFYPSFNYYDGHYYYLDARTGKTVVTKRQLQSPQQINISASTAQSKGISNNSVSSSRISANQGNIGIN